MKRFVRTMVLVPALAWAPGVRAGGTGAIEGTLDGAAKAPVVVYLERVDGAKAPAAPAVMTQRRNTYLPHVLPVVAGAKVEFRSEDPELHNLYAWSKAEDRMVFNVAQVPGAPAYSRTFPNEGVVRMTCNVHKEMLAFIVVLQNPYFAVVEKKETAFKLPEVPPGKYQLRVWSEKLDDDALARRIPVEVTPGGTARVSITQ